jgi:hypothetical protein
MLVLRRESLLRKPLYFGVPLALALPLVLPDEGSTGWLHFCLLVLAPLLGLGLGLTTTRSDFWAALIPPRRIALAEAGCHLSALSLLAGGSAWLLRADNRGIFELFDPHRPEASLFALALPLFPLGLYTLSALSRRFGRGLVGLVGPLLWLGALGLGGQADWEGGRWSVLEGLTLRLLLTVIAGPLALYTCADIRPRARDAGRLIGGGLVLGLFSLLPAQFWSGQPLLVAPGRVVERDGRLLEIPEMALVFGPRQAWLTEGGVRRPIGPPGALFGELGPAGSVALVHVDGAGGGVLFLTDGEDTVAQCPLPKVDLTYLDLRFRSDGEAVGHNVFGSPADSRVLQIDGACLGPEGMPALGFVSDPRDPNLPLRPRQPDPHAGLDPSPADGAAPVVQE